MDESEVLKFEREVRPLKLSEAIRIGSRIRPQLRTGLYQEDGMSCALGAAYEAETGIFRDSALLPDEWLEPRLPILNEYEKQYGARLIHDNDGGMPREVIADRLEVMGH